MFIKEIHYFKFCFSMVDTLNTSYQEAIQMSPYEAVFGQKARSDILTEMGPGLFFCEENIDNIISVIKRFVSLFINHFNNISSIVINFTFAYGWSCYFPLNIQIYYQNVLTKLVFSQYLAIMHTPQWKIWMMLLKKMMTKAIKSML